MATEILLKRSGNTAENPDPSTLSLGELCLNYNDGFLYFRDNLGRLFALQAHIMSYAFTTVNVNTTLLTASLNATTLSMNTDTTLQISVDQPNNAIEFSLSNTVTNVISNAYNQANAAYAAANLALDTATVSLNGTNVLIAAGINFNNSASINVSAIANGSNQVNVAFSANVSSHIKFNVQNTNYTLALSDVNGTVYHNIAASNGYFINTVANAGWQLGDLIRIIAGSGSGNVNIAPVTGVTLRQANTVLASGNVNVPSNNIVTVEMIETNVWIAARL